MAFDWSKIKVKSEGVKNAPPKDPYIVRGHFDYIRIHCVTGKETTGILEAGIKEVLWNERVNYVFEVITESVTGYESWYIDNFTECKKMSEWFCACAGTEGRWDTLKMNRNQVKEFCQKFLENNEQNH